jgi:hypothetical protein
MPDNQNSASQSTDAAAVNPDPRSCTCHPDEAPVPCQHQYAYRACRERALLCAAEDVLSRWAVVRASGGYLGACGMPDALKALDVACGAYPEEELQNGE